MKRISLITVYNNQQLLNEMIASAKKQRNVDIEYVMIDNMTNKFSSAASALNYGTDRATGDVFVFLHQDIEFEAENALERIYDFAIENKNVIFGAGGVTKRARKEKTHIYSAMWEGVDRDGIEWKSQYVTLKEPLRCFTLDECLIACHSSCMKYIRFDEETCDGWHLYATDICLQAGLNDKLDVMVIPMDYVWHKSRGNVDEAYFNTQNKLAKKYRGKYKYIYTPNGFQYTNSIKRYFLNLYRNIRK